MERKIVQIRKVDKGFVKNGGCIYTMECLICKKYFEINGGQYNSGLGKTDSVKCRNIYLGKKMKGKLKSREHRNNLSKSLMGKLIGKKNPNWGNKYTFEQRKNVSRGLKKFHKENSDFKSKGFTGKKHTDETKRLMSKQKNGVKKSKEWKEKIGGRNSYRWGKPPAHGRGGWYVRKDGKKVWMRSSYELRFAGWLDDSNLAWKYEPKRFELEDRTYAPDFWVEEWQEWIEIKGWFHKRHQETVKQFRELYSKEKISVWKKDRLQQLGII